MPETKVLFFQETVTEHVRPVSTPSVDPLPQQVATAHTPLSLCPDISPKQMQGTGSNGNQAQDWHCWHRKQDPSVAYFFNHYYLQFII